MKSVALLNLSKPHSNWEVNPLQAFLVAHENSAKNCVTLLSVFRIYEGCPAQVMRKNHA